MCRNLFAPLPVAMLLLLAVGLPAHAACTAGNPNASVIESTPTSDFAAFGTADVTVTHNKTGLTWKRCAEGQAWNGSTCTGTATTMPWENALKAANTANTAAFAGYTDWRLPNKKELESIVEFCGYNPAINQTAFPATPASDFWSGSSYAQDLAGAWPVVFGTCCTQLFLKTNFYYVRLVRGGQSVDSFDLFIPAPQCTLTASPSTITLGGSATLTATCSPAASSYAWTPATGLIAGPANTATVTPTAVGVYQYSVTGSNTGGAGNTASTLVTVDPATFVSQSDCLFNWAERNYASLFAPTGAISNTLTPYYYRYYPQTNAYLGTSSADNHVYYYGPLSNNSLLDVGAMSPLLSTAGCQ